MATIDEDDLIHYTSHSTGTGGGEISAIAFREFFSAAASFGTMYMQNNVVPTVITAINVPVKIAGTTIAGLNNQRFSHSDNRLTHTGTYTRDFKIDALGSVESAAPTNRYGFFIYKNGSVLVGSEQDIVSNTGGRVNQFAIQTIAEAAKDDYFEIWVEDLSGDTDLTISFLNVTIIPLT